MCVLSWLVFLIGHQYLIGVWHGEDQITNTLTTTCLSSNFITYSTLSSEHNLEDPCIQSGIHQTCTSDEPPITITKIKGQPIPNPNLDDAPLQICYSKHKSRRANLISRSRRERNHRTRAYPLLHPTRKT